MNSGLLRNSVLLRHLTVGLLASGLTYGFWLTRPEWVNDMRFWRAVGDASFMLLFFTLAIGPLVKFWPALSRLIPWRREMGIWYGLLAIGHTYLVLDGWVRWDFLRFFGYEFLPQLERYARLEPGFGLANAMGIIAAAGTLLLVATSSNRAINLLGPSAWKYLQNGAYVVFYLVALHTLYFLFIHYTLSFHRPVPEDANWFRYPFLALVAAIPILQTAAYVKTVARKTRTPEKAEKQRPKRRGAPQARKA
jgi:methionine sulfoxide reductase heme-binding subunit